MKTLIKILVWNLTFFAPLLGQQGVPVKDLSVGNRFVYLSFTVKTTAATTLSDTIPFRYYEEVLRDTTINSLTYGVVYSSYDKSIRFERSNDTAVYGWRNGKDELLYSWNMKKGDSATVDILGLVFRGQVSQAFKIPDGITGEIGLLFDIHGYPYKNIEAQLALACIPKYGITTADIYTPVPRQGYLPTVIRHIMGAVIDGVVIRDTALYRTTSVELVEPLATVSSPNPFSEALRIEYELKQSATVEVVISSVDGKQITTLKQGRQNAGKQALIWNGKAENGSEVAAGSYLISFIINNQKAHDVKAVKVR